MSGIIFKEVPKQKSGIKQIGVDSLGVKLYYCYDCAFYFSDEIKSRIEHQKHHQVIVRTSLK